MVAQRAEVCFQFRWAKHAFVVRLLSTLPTCFVMWYLVWQQMCFFWICPERISCNQIPLKLGQAVKYMKSMKSNPCWNIICKWASKAPGLFPSQCLKAHVEKFTDLWALISQSPLTLQTSLSLKCCSDTYSQCFHIHLSNLESVILNIHREARRHFSG